MVKPKDKKAGANLGRALMKDRFNRKHQRTVDNDTMLHTTEVQDGYNWGRLNLTSVTEESSFQEFVRTAELAGAEFKAEKLNVSFVGTSHGLITNAEENSIKKKHVDHRKELRIPRRPKWTAEVTREEQDKNEKESFLEWRRLLAVFQETAGLILTPYEKNIQFWRQLWRVVELSDIVFQIVDARNPLLFRCIDLENYVKEVDARKQNVILVNKSDYLTEPQRKYWAEYFDKDGIRAIFFSATMADEALKEADEVKDEENKPVVSSQDSKETDSSIEVATEVLKNNADILTRAQLIDEMRSLHKTANAKRDFSTIGMVGYPNVGKSSTINALMAVKKVSVSATPGKTKHYQTLHLDKDIHLCDCPGLVFPSFVCTKADMLLNGILPIAEMRDPVLPVDLICRRIPRHILESKYGIMIAKPKENEDQSRSPRADEFLLAYSYFRGYMTSRGQPDLSRSARCVCKDYLSGKLLYCIAPPTVPQEEYHIFPENVAKTESVQRSAVSIPKGQSVRTRNDETFDSQQFFDTYCHPYIKGRVSLTNQGSIVNAAPGEKPWRAKKKEPRQKLRNKFAHLDIH